MPYAVPNVKVDWVHAEVGVPVGFWRSVGHSHSAFFDESFEALDTMEAALLKLNVGAPEPELINTIFRVAHSIKGGSATFGFAEVASFTHTCETLLDELRSNRMQVTRVLTDLLLTRDALDQELWDAFHARRVDRAQAVVDASNQLAQWQLDHVRGDAPGLMRGIAQLVAQPA